MSNEEQKELAEYHAAKATATHFSQLPEEQLRRVMYDTVFSLLSAMKDRSDIPANLHPSDLVTRLQRGNIIKDGNW